MNFTSKSDKQIIWIIIVSMFYVTVKLTCNPLFFRHIEFDIPTFNSFIVLKVVSSTFIFPLVYVLSDLITALSNKRIAMIIILVGIVCDGFFSYSVYHISNMAIPQSMSDTELNNAHVVNYLGYPLWQLYYSGVIGSIITSIIEVLLFNKLYNKIHNFFIATIISIIVVMVIHNPIAAFPLWSEPDYWSVVINGLFVDISFMILYVLMAYLINKMYLFYKLNFRQ